MAKKSNAEYLLEMDEKTKAVEGGVLIKDYSPPLKNVKTDKWLNSVEPIPTEHPIMVHKRNNAQQSVQWIAFGAGAAGVLFGIVVTLIVVFVLIGVR